MTSARRVSQLRRCRGHSACCGQIGLMTNSSSLAATDESHQLDDQDRLITILRQLEEPLNFIVQFPVLDDRRRRRPDSVHERVLRQLPAFLWKYEFLMKLL